MFDRSVTAISKRAPKKGAPIANNPGWIDMEEAAEAPAPPKGKGKTNQPGKKGNDASGEDEKKPDETEADSDSEDT